MLRWWKYLEMLRGALETRARVNVNNVVILWNIYYSLGTTRILIRPERHRKWSWSGAESEDLPFQNRSSTIRNIFRRRTKYILWPEIKGNIKADTVYN